MTENPEYVFDRRANEELNYRFDTANEELKKNGFDELN
tara:strand:- start:127 stop:240 length:114 start_codon:yes stop_codon:yes gene_type:complete